MTEASCPLCKPDPELVFYRGALVSGLWDDFLRARAAPFWSRRGMSIADVFKFRNKIGIDVALEALHEAWRE